MIFAKNPQEGLPFNPYLSPDGQVKLLFWIPQTLAVGREEPPPSGCNTVILHSPPVITTIIAC